LISAFAARHAEEVAAGNGFPRYWYAGRNRHQIHIQTADNRDFGHF
jgi:hypothetical protein